MGMMLSQGQGMPVNYELALTWLRRAAASGDDRIASRAQSAADQLGEVMEAANRRIDRVRSEYGKVQHRRGGSGRRREGVEVTRDPVIVREPPLKQEL